MTFTTPNERDPTHFLNTSKESPHFFDFFVLSCPPPAPEDGAIRPRAFALAAERPRRARRRLEHHFSAERRPGGRRARRESLVRRRVRVWNDALRPRPRPASTAAAPRDRRRTKAWPVAAPIRRGRAPSSGASPRARFGARHRDPAVPFRRRERGHLVTSRAICARASRAMKRSAKRPRERCGYRRESRIRRALDATPRATTVERRPDTWRRFERCDSSPRVAHARRARRASRTCTRFGREREHFLDSSTKTSARGGDVGYFS